MASEGLNAVVVAVSSTTQQLNRILIGSPGRQ